MTTLSTNYSLSRMLETPEDFKTQLSSLIPKQIEKVVKGWLEECNGIKPGTYKPSELYKQAICVLPASSKEHFLILAEAFGFKFEDSQSFTWHKSMLLDSDFGRKLLCTNCSIDMEKATNLQLQLRSFEFLQIQGIAPTAKEFQAMLSEELLDVPNINNKDIYDLVLNNGSIKDVEQLLTFVREKRGDEALHKFVESRSWSARNFIKRKLERDAHLLRAKQLVTLYQKLDLDPKTFIFNPENKDGDLLSMTDCPKLLEYLLMQLTEKERYEACKLRGNNILFFAEALWHQDIAKSKQGLCETIHELCETIHKITGLTKEEFINHS